MSQRGRQRSSPEGKDWTGGLSPAYHGSASAGGGKEREGDSRLKGTKGEVEKWKRSYNFRATYIYVIRSNSFHIYGANPNPY